MGAKRIYEAGEGGYALGMGYQQQLQQQDLV